MNIIFGNYGNQTIAVMQWASEKQLKDVHVISVDTAWAPESWQKPVAAAEIFAKQCGFEVVRLQSKLSFQDLMRDRQEFSTTKFQWCAGFLKGLPLLDWLDEKDPFCESTIILGKRRADSRANFDLPEFIDESEFYGDRKIWYPLFDCNDDQFKSLIAASGLAFLPHRSLECDPCVNSFGADLARVSEKTIVKVNSLETEIGKSMFEFPIEDMVKQARGNTDTNSEHTIEMFDMGCGSPYGCGE